MKVPCEMAKTAQKISNVLSIIILRVQQSESLSMRLPLI